LKRTWTSVDILAPVIIQMRNEESTRQQIADALGLEKIQIKNWINRYNRRQKALPKVSRRRGRPRKRLLSTPESLVLRIKELEREVELYRSFLQAAGRM
jgi:transposase